MSVTKYGLGKHLAVIILRLMQDVGTTEQGIHRHSDQWEEEIGFKTCPYTPCCITICKKLTLSESRLPSP